jgi:hypothetical protein
LTKLLAGHLHEAFEHYRQALAIYDPNGHGGFRFQSASDQGAIARAPLAWGEAIAGKTRSSFQNAKKAIGLASRLRHPHTTAHVTCVLAARAQTLGDLNTAAALAHAGKTLGEQFEFPYWSAWADLILGWVNGRRGSAAGIVLIENAMAAYQKTGARQRVLTTRRHGACGREAAARARCNEPRLGSGPTAWTSSLGG